MECSKCSNGIKPVVAVDIDGTLADYHHHLANFCAEYWGLALPWGGWQGDGNFEDWLGITQAQYREAKLAFRQGGMKRTMPVYDEASQQWIANLRHLGVEVWVTTTRPWQRLDNVDPDTRWWLAKHGFEFDYLLFNENKYKVLAETVDPNRVIMVVDDLREMCEQAQEARLPAFQVARHHNDLDAFRVRRSMFAIHGITFENLTEWRKAYG